AIPFFKRLIRYVLVPMGYNTVYLEFAGGMRFDSHPKISEAWLEGNKKADEGLWPPVPHGSMVAGGDLLEKSEVRDLIEFMKSYGLEVIPEVQSLGHVQYITMAYPEIAETQEDKDDKKDIDLKKEDTPPSEFYHGSYCPSNDMSYKIIFDIIDEIVDVVEPERYVHMGHDEVYVIGTCPVCKKEDPAHLLARHLNALHAHLAKKGLKMMIWADMLQNVTKYKTPAAIDMIPKDIVLLDFIWYFHTDKDIEDHLLSHGFEVIMGNMYSSHYPRFESRIRKGGMIGAEVSTWKRVDEYNLGFEGKIYDFLYSGNMLWSKDYKEDFRYSYDEIITGFMPYIRERLSAKGHPSLDEEARGVNISLPKPDKNDIVPYELMEAIDGIMDTKYMQVATLDNPITISIDDRFDSIKFYHTASKNAERIPWEDPIETGRYIISYEDGTKIIVPIEYGTNIYAWNKRANMPITKPYYRHQGYVGTYFADPFIRANTRDGEDVSIFAYEWVNPHREKSITSIELVKSGDTDSFVILGAIKGYRLA
ncbi:MAG: family 20 glycosylhydrolase, partial [Clostridiales bacterium]|nr:family 20 glycosylhydrolase [Clostridiales bacterium]